MKLLERAHHPRVVLRHFGHDQAAPRRAVATACDPPPRDEPDENMPGLSLIISTALALAGGAAHTAPSGLAYSSASARVVQPQPAAGSCHPVGSGLNQRPDRRCTPGAVNPAVTQATIGSTICKSGWTASVRPSESITAPEKLASLRAYGESPASRFEYDHFVPLELGGAVNDARNLWPEPDYAARHGFYLNPKDLLETSLKHRVCDGRMTLTTAQREIAANWVSALARYG